MQKFSFQHIIHADSEKVFQNISDFSSYKYFLPGCLDSHLISKDADKIIGFLSFEILSKIYSITSENRVTKDTITIRQLDGPFKKFQATWTIISLGQGHTKACLVAELSVPIIYRAIINEKTAKFFSSKFISAFENYLK